MNPSMQLGADILAYGKNLAPDRFPRIDTQRSQASRNICQAWGDTLANVPLPAEIWPEAIRFWALHAVGDRMATPRDIRDAAYRVRDLWETTPGRREYLAHARQQAQHRRDQQLAQGTFGQLRGYKSRAIERPAPQESAYGREVIQVLLRRVGRPLGESTSPQDRRIGP